jgi:anhydro-N-acetylmuramic acid kinase
MSGSSLDGLDMAFVELEESFGKWSFSILHAECIPYSTEWEQKLREATSLSARDYLLLDTEYGHHIGQSVSSFIDRHQLRYKVALIASHGHTTFHLPPMMTAQIGSGAAISIETGIPVVSDLRSVDVALGGQGAPMVPIGERLLWPDVSMFLNIGGIANLSVNTPDGYIAYDVCPANRILNKLAMQKGMTYDEGGRLAAIGKVDDEILTLLNTLPYYAQSYPKSLDNAFGDEVVWPLLLSREAHIPEDFLATYTEHIALQIAAEVEKHLSTLSLTHPSIMVTGGGALNDFLLQRIQDHLAPMRVQVDRPDEKIVQYKEALVMALLGVLRWREEPTALCSVTGASRDSIGGALWVTE